MIFSKDPECLCVCVGVRVCVRLCVCVSFFKTPLYISEKREKRLVPDLHTFTAGEATLVLACKARKEIWLCALILRNSYLGNFTTGASEQSTAIL
jgi:hypothetical protein